ncbi:NADH-quinone oxidoreductase subunit B family protein [Candidatus Margulisiibacteriota bacterium]
MKKLFKWGLKKSPAVFHAGASACNNCDIEILDLLTPRFDVERFGVTLAGSIRHADVLLVTGVANKKIAEKLKSLYEQMPAPKVVAAIGSCACSGIMFRDSYNVTKPIDQIIPVNIYIPGCPPKPESMIAALVKALNSL